MDTTEIDKVMKQATKDRLAEVDAENRKWNVSHGWGPNEKAPNGMPAWVMGPKPAGASMRQVPQPMVRTSSGIERGQKRASSPRTTSSRAQEHDELGGVEEAIRRSQLDNLLGGARRNKARRSKARRSKARKSKPRKSKPRKSKPRKSKARKSKARKSKASKK